MNLGNNKWLNADVQARIKTPPTPLIKAKNRKTKETNIIKINMCQDPVSATSDHYKLKLQTFENGKPEELLQVMKDFKTGFDGTGTSSAQGGIKFLRTMLCVESLKEFDVIAGQIGSTNNAHLKQIKEGLFNYSPPPNALNKHKRSMRRAMRKS